MRIPNSPGGGYDQTGRAAVSVMEQDDITGGTFEVTNILGAGGSVAMTRLMDAEGDEHTMMTVGLGVVGSLYSFGAGLPAPGRHAARPADRGPGGRAGAGRLAVQDHRRLRRGLEGGPALGRRRRRLVARRPRPPVPDAARQAVGIDPNDVRYVPYDGGGPLTSALLGNKIQVGFSGLGEFEGQIEAGELRALAVSGEERLEGEAVKDVPTLTESGIDLVFTNWRGVLARPASPTSAATS